MDKATEKRFWSKVDIREKDECWEWLGAKDPNGYGVVHIYNEHVAAHRAAFMMSGGVLTRRKPFVCHKCDNPKCVNPAHLFAGSPQDNMTDMIIKDKTRAIPKLSVEQVKAIKQLIKKGEMPLYKIANMFSISYVSIINIKTGKTWKNI